MSSYNGEKYIEEQMDSLLRQKDVDVRILVRDDGSKDRTLEILEGYAQRNPNVRYFKGSKNLGPAKSFLELMTHYPEYPDCYFYAFCDQDDVWDDDKIICAVNMLKKEEQKLPLLYYSNLRIVDQDLNFCRNSHTGAHVSPNRFTALMQNHATGCTVVYNRTAMELVVNHMPEDVTMHDSWTYRVCSVFGKTIYDPEPHISYRQHGGNVVGTYQKRLSYKVYVKQFKRLFRKDFQPRFNSVKTFYDLYGDMVDPEIKEKLIEVVEYKESIPKTLKLLFDKDLRIRGRQKALRTRALIALRRV